jgi:hypothetical protein
MFGAEIRSWIGWGIAAVFSAASPALAQEGGEFAEDGLTDEFAFQEHPAGLEMEWCQVTCRVHFEPGRL